MVPLHPPLLYLESVFNWTHPVQCCRPKERSGAGDLAPPAWLIPKQQHYLHHMNEHDLVKNGPVPVSWTGKQSQLLLKSDNCTAVLLVHEPCVHV